MLIRGQTTEQRIAEIANGFGKGLDNFNQGQNQQRAQSLQDEALKRQQAMQAFEIESKLSEQTGKAVPQGTGAAVLNGMPVDFSALKAMPKTAKAEAEARKVERENLKFQQDQEEVDYKRTQRTLPVNQRDSFQEKAALAGVTAKNKVAGTPKQNEFAAAGYSKRARQAEEELSALPEGIGAGSFDGLDNYTPAVFKGQNTKLFEQAKRNFITANLRKESGASIADDEYANEEKKYFAQPGDGKAVLAQKKRAREQAVLNLEAEGANALDRVGNASRPINQSVSTQQAAPKVNQAAVNQIKSMSDEELRRFVQGG